MDNIKNQFNIEKARNGEVVEIFNSVFGDWSLLGTVYWIGTDLQGNVLYQFNNDVNIVRKIHHSRLRMKPKTVVWWFRTYVNKEGMRIPRVHASLNITEFPVIEKAPWFEGKCEWIEDAWSKEIPK